MMIRFGLLIVVLAIGLTALSSECYGLDIANRRTLTHCAAKRTDSCDTAPAMPRQSVVLPSDTVIQRPLARPPSPGKRPHDLSESFCTRSEDCR